MTAYELAQTEGDLFHFHHLLESKVARLRQLCAERAAESEPTWSSLVAAEFEEFAGALVAHFEAEESLRYFKDLLEAHPELQQSVEALLADHRKMILILEQIRDCILAAVPPEKLAAEIERLLEAFAAHERTEREIVETAYGDEPSEEG